MPTIKLQSSDGEIFDVEVEIAKASNTIKAMIEGAYVQSCTCIEPKLQELYTVEPLLMDRSSSNDWDDNTQYLMYPTCRLYT